jgi:polysaccharide biosynthesis protein PslG
MKMKMSLLPVVFWLCLMGSFSGFTSAQWAGIPEKQVCSGVNIHFTTGHERDLDMIAAAGFKFIRTDFVWADIERVRGVYDWKAYDELTANLNKRGLRALYILDYSNPLYEAMVESKDPITGEKQEDIASPRSPESVAAFARWASEAAVRFSGNNIIWEIWNEPNVSFWRPVPDPEDYNTLALATCRAVRSAAPGSVIIGPATSQIPLQFIETFLASGVLACIDAVSVHPYRDYSLPPESVSADYAKVNELIDRYTPAGKKRVPVISSEWGYASCPKGVTIEKQAMLIVRMQLANLLSGIPLSVWYDWKNDGDQPDNFEHNCGTVTSDLRPKPAYTAIQTLNRELNEFTFSRRLETGNSNDYLLVFINGRGIFKICGWTLDTPHSVMIDNIVPLTGDITATDGYGNGLKPGQQGGKLLMELSGMPQYVSLPDGVRITVNGKATGPGASCYFNIRE